MRAPACKPAARGGGKRRWRKWFFAHSNPYVESGYLPKDSRRQLRDELNRVKSGRFNREKAEPPAYRAPYPEETAGKREEPHQQGTKEQPQLAESETPLRV